MSTTTRALLCAAFAAAAVSARGARADIVHLDDGRRIEGKLIEESAERVRIDTRAGIQEFARAQVKSIERVKTPWEEYRERALLLSPKDAEGRYRLGLWCRERNLVPEALAEFRRAVEANPDHAGARKELGFVKTAKGWVQASEAPKPEDSPRSDEADLAADDRGPIAGFVKVDNRWLTPEDQRQADAGKVRYKGVWMTPEEREKRRQGLIEERGRWMPVEEADRAHQDWSSAWVIHTLHYELRTNTSRHFADDVAELLEIAYPEFARLLGGPPSKKLTILLFRLHEEYARYLSSQRLDRLQDSDAFFHAESRLVVAWSGREGKHLRHFLLGPAAFQYYYECYENALPSWISAALAVYYRSNKLEKGVLIPGLPNAVVLKNFDKAARTDNLIPLARLMRMELAEAYDRNLIEFYEAQSYLLLGYLREEARGDVRSKFEDWLIRVRKAPFIMGNADLLSADWWREDLGGADRFGAFERDFFEWAKRHVAAEIRGE
jgi:hypothetical protein